MSLNYDKAMKVKEQVELFEFITETILHPFMRLRQIIDVGAKEGNEGRTHQSHKEACDVNSIVMKYDNTGNLPKNQKGEGQFGDATALQGDLTEMLNHSRSVVEQVAAEIEKRDLDAKNKAALKAQKEAEQAEIKALQDRLDSLKAPSQGDNGGDS